jgi:hypothetical protein
MFLNNDEIIQKLKEMDEIGFTTDDFEIVGADLRGANLTGANLEGSHLEDANLTDAILSYAILKDARLEKAKLNGAKLKGSNLEGAHLEDADLRSLDRGRVTDLNLAILKNAHLERAHLEGVNLTGANLTGAHLEGSHLTGANVDNIIATPEEIIIIQRLARPPHPPANVATEIHKFKDKLLADQDFIRILGFDQEPLLNTVNTVVNYDSIKEKFIQFINENHFEGVNKTDLKNQLTTVIDKVKLASTPGHEANRINKAIDFVFRQDPKFIEAYIKTFIDESFKAYSSNPSDNTSCFAGIRERFYTSVLGASLEVKMIQNYLSTHPVIKELSCIALRLNFLELNLNNELQNWSNSWNTDGNDITKKGEWQRMKREQRKENLKDFLLKDIKSDECYESIKTKLDSEINTILEQYNYVFDNDDDPAVFGGSSKKCTKRGKGKTKRRKCKTKRRKCQTTRRKGQTKRRKGQTKRKNNRKILTKKMH